MVKAPILILVAALAAACQACTPCGNGNPLTLIYGAQGNITKQIYIQWGMSVAFRCNFGHTDIVNGTIRINGEAPNSAFTKTTKHESVVILRVWNITESFDNASFLCVAEFPSSCGICTSNEIIVYIIDIPRPPQTTHLSDVKPTEVTLPKSSLPKFATEDGIGGANVEIKPNETDGTTMDSDTATGIPVYGIVLLAVAAVMVVVVVMAVLVCMVVCMVKHWDHIKSRIYMVNNISAENHPLTYPSHRYDSINNINNISVSSSITEVASNEQNNKKDADDCPKGNNSPPSLFQREDAVQNTASVQDETSSECGTDSSEIEKAVEIEDPFQEDNTQLDASSVTENVEELVEKEAVTDKEESLQSDDTTRDEEDCTQGCGDTHEDVPHQLDGEVCGHNNEQSSDDQTEDTDGEGNGHEDNIDHMNFGLHINTKSDPTVFPKPAAVRTLPLGQYEYSRVPPVQPQNMECPSEEVPVAVLQSTGHDNTDLPTSKNMVLRDPPRNAAARGSTQKSTPGQPRLSGTGTPHSDNGSTHGETRTSDETDSAVHNEMCHKAGQFLPTVEMPVVYMQSIKNGAGGLESFSTTTGR